jgi:predicted amidophosphoribosyltransferase
VSALSATLKNLAKRGLGLVYQEVCQLCHDESAEPEGGFIGRRCLIQLKPIDVPFCRRCGQPFEVEISDEFECTNCREMGLNFEFALGVMRGTPEMLNAIHKFKYQLALWLESLFRRQFAAGKAEQICSWRGDCLVPISLYPVRFLECGFNQSETLCRNLSRDVALPVVTRALKRIRVNRVQALLSRGERLANLRGAFASNKLNLNGKRVVACR